MGFRRNAGFQGSADSYACCKDTCLLKICSAGCSRFQAESRGTPLNVSETSLWHKGKRHILENDQEGLPDWPSCQREDLTFSVGTHDVVKLFGQEVGWRATIIVHLSGSCVRAPPQTAVTRGSHGSAAGTRDLHRLFMRTRANY